ncbi:MAG: siderophore-interacting protein [Symbiopectobacterium sp.]
MLAHKTYLMPSMMRCVFSGESVHQIKMNALDQRIKLLLPPPMAFSPNCLIVMSDTTLSG